MLLLPPRSVVLGCAYCLLNVVGQKRQQVAAFLYLVRDLLIEIEFIENRSPRSGARHARRPLCSVFRGPMARPRARHGCGAEGVVHTTACPMRGKGGRKRFPPDNLPTWNAMTAINADLNSHHCWPHSCPICRAMRLLGSVSTVFIVPVLSLRAPSRAGPSEWSHLRAK